MAKKKKRKIVVLQADLKNELVTELLDAEEGDDVLKKYVQVYKEALEDEGIEVFQTYSYFLVCEDSIYIVLYADEMKQIEKDLSQNVNKKD